MSPARSDDPLRRVTLNLYEADVALAERIYGHGWSEHLRRMFHEWLVQHTVIHIPRRLGDLPE